MSSGPTRRRLLRNAAALASAGVISRRSFGGLRALPVGAATGPFTPTWESLSAYRTPEWFRDAKFGIWAHWSAQCVPEQGDWYARRMYMQGDSAYDFHVKKYGHPTEFGYKEIPHLWQAEKWQPEKLVGRYKAAGAKYFFALAVHHDNFDNWDSTHHA